MKLSDFDYNLPKELIAQYPLKRRDAARLLVLDRHQKTIQHRNFKDIVEYLKKDDLLTLNDTRVMPARLIGRRLSGGKVDVLLLSRKEGSTFNALIKPARIKINEKIIFNEGKITGIATAKNEISFFAKNLDVVYNQGKMPIPPYIKREPQVLDNIYYQTVYAKNPGAIAAPTAGLHFTKRLLKRIASGGVNIAYITLHISYATFKPVKVQDITKHKMEKEYFRLPQETPMLIEQARAQKRRIFAVGTTSLRALETYYSGINEGHTDLFIYPGYQFKIVDCLLTNFHLPRTTLFMLVCAFAGIRLIKEAYQQAIDKEYRFYSYGDAMLII
jgi:S-adenosylmethionine:tRNA ribosyltransferase-isomerase